MNPAEVYLAALNAELSKRTMRHALNTVARSLYGGRATPKTVPWASVGYADMVKLRNSLAKRYEPATVNLYMRAARGVLATAWRMGLITMETLTKVREVKLLRLSDEKHGRMLTGPEIKTVLSSPLLLRDRALFAVAVGCGLRRIEITRLSLEDYDVAANTLRIFGKGDKERTAFLQPRVKAYLDAWLVELRTIENGKIPASHPIFPRAGNEIVPAFKQRLTVEGVSNILKRISERSGVAFKPHDLRKTFVSSLLEAKVDTFLVRDLAGHASVETTRRYDLRPVSKRREAAALFDLPE